MFKLLSTAIVLLIGAVAIAYAPYGGIGSTWLTQARAAMGTKGADSASAHRYAELSRGKITSSVAATGTLTPVATVVVGTQVSGQIKEIYADFNSLVKKGDIIAIIDPVTFQHAADMAEAELAMSRAALQKTHVMLREADAELERKTTLLSRSAGSTVEHSKAAATRDLAQTQVEDAVAAVHRAEAALRRARIDLERTRIRAPVDGIVIQRAVAAGQTVAASLQAPDLFTIAQDLRDMLVHAQIDESEIGKILPGQVVEFRVDAHPTRRFNGTVEMIRKQPRTVQNVVTYTVIVKASNPDLVLLPGMTASARFIVADSSDVTKAPNAALRFRPAGHVAPASPHIWVEENGRLRALSVRVGLTDGTFTEISGEGLSVGTRVVVGIEAARRERSTAKRLLGVF